MLKKIAKLIDVKSLVTLALTASFIILSENLYLKKTVFQEIVL